MEEGDCALMIERSMSVKLKGISGWSCAERARPVLMTPAASSSISSSSKT